MPRESVKRGRPGGALRNRDAFADPDDGCMTLAQVADSMGLTRERIRQIEGQAMSKVRALLYERGYKCDELFDLGRMPSSRSGQNNRSE